MKKVAIGSKVKLEFGDGNAADIVLVNPSDADIFQRKISCDSPVGSAILGKNEGDSAVYSNPKKNTISCKIVAIN